MTTTPKPRVYCVRYEFETLAQAQAFTDAVSTHIRNAPSASCIYTRTPYTRQLSVDGLTRAERHVLKQMLPGRHYTGQDAGVWLEEAHFHATSARAVLVSLNAKNFITRAERNLYTLAPQEPST